MSLRFALSLALLLVTATCAAEEGKLLQIWGLPEQDAFAGWIRVLEEYDLAHPEVRILRGSPGGQESGGVDRQKLMTAVVSGKPPDLLWMDRFTMAGWASRGVFRALDDLYERDHIDRADLYKACLDECMYQGKTYGLPWDTDSRALWCNMDLLEEAGYKEPPKNWDELKEMAIKLTKRTPEGKFQQIGFAPMIGNAWLYIYGFQNGGEFMSADGTRCTLADPRIAEALAWMKEVYDGLGGAKPIMDFQTASQAEGAADPFRSNRIAMQITENSALDYMAKFRPDMRLYVGPPPSPEGKPIVSWSGGFCWAIPKDATATDEAWTLTKYLATPAAWDRYIHFQEVANKAKAAEVGTTQSFTIPRLSCSRKVNTLQIQYAETHLPKTIADAFRAHVTLLDNCRFRPVTPVGSQLWDEQARATNNVLYDNKSPGEALKYGQMSVQRELDLLLKPSADPVFSIKKTFGLIFGAILILCGAIWAGAASRWKWNMRSRAEARAGLLFALPWLIGFFVLMFGPMVASLMISFTRYDVLNPARWVGARNYQTLAGADPLFWKSLSNTGFMAIIGVPIGLVVSLGLALLVNREVRGIRIYRTLLYLPVVVPTVAASVLWLWFLNNETGFTGAALVPILNKLKLPTPSFFGDPTFMKLGVILLVTWTAGSSMIIFLAGLKGIPATYYEAAAIDGAGPFKQFIHVTLPMLSPYLFFSVIMGIIGWLQIFIQPYVFITPPGFGPGDAMLTYLMYLFTQGFRFFNMGMACAMAWILFVIVAALTLIQFKLAPRWVHYDV
ncbi:MAG: extracellular solute-binding protein [Candidatus Sumerlaeaceae bacterium]